MRFPDAPSRRAIIRGTAGLAVATTASLPAMAQDTGEFPLTGPDPTEVLPLWPGHPPGGPVQGLTQTTVERENPYKLRDRATKFVTRPTVTVFRPERSTGAALLLIPGGGYAHVVVDKEGFETARLLASQGVTVFVLLYRLPQDGWAGGPDTPLQDAQRAMRLIRHGAKGFGIDPSKVGVQGFSAGGHLAASLATRFAEAAYAPVDAADSLSARPDHACLVYPVITLSTPATHAGSARNMLGENPDPARVARYSPDQTVVADTPPTFLLHAFDDKAVPVDNSLMMLAALRKAGIPAEAHLFEEGGHGFGLRGLEGKPVAAWPRLYSAWAKRRGYFS